MLVVSKCFGRRIDFLFDFVVSHNGAVAYDSEGNVLFSQAVNGNMKWRNSTLVQELVKICLQETGRHCGVAFEKSRIYFHPDSLKRKEVDNSFYSPLSALQQVEEFNANASCKNEE